jgi:hypothetical protein
MLRREAVRPELLGVLEKLMLDKNLLNYHLVGGTALALQIGHRDSIDIDLFTQDEIIHETIEKSAQCIAPLEIVRKNAGGMTIMVNNVKVDFVRHNYPLLNEMRTVEGVRMYSLIDIAAMKTHAIVKRGSKKDFIDLYFLLKQFNLEEIIQAYKTKYSDSLQEPFILKSMIYFADAESADSPTIFEKTDWFTIKEGIRRAVNEYWG